MKRTGSSNVLKRKLIQQLWNTKVGAWRSVSEKLNVPSRNAKSINLHRISKHANKGDVIVVPGKVLGTGQLGEAITLACYQISKSAKQKAEDSGSVVLTIEQALEKYPTGKGVRIFW